MFRCFCIRRFSSWISDVARAPPALDLLLGIQPHPALQSHPHRTRRPPECGRTSISVSHRRKTMKACYPSLTSLSMTLVIIGDRSPNFLPAQRTWLWSQVFAGSHYYSLVIVEIFCNQNGTYVCADVMNPKSKSSDAFGNWKESISLSAYFTIVRGRIMKNLCLWPVPCRCRFCEETKL